jgi:hypothetical protein
MLAYKLREEPRQYYLVKPIESGLQVVFSRNFLEELYRDDPRGQNRAFFDSVNVCQGENNTVSVIFTFPYITFPNIAHKKRDWKQMDAITSVLETLLDYLNHFSDGDRFPTFPISEEPQLMILEIFTRVHFQSINVGFSPYALTTMQTAWGNGYKLPDTQRKITETYERLSTSRRRDFLRNTSTRYQNWMADGAYIREHGVPQFQVAGNCACLGANPDEFKHEPDLTPHNLDTQLQLLTMTVGVTHFWNEYLIPLCSKK